MTKCIVMCGSTESLRALREAFRNLGVDLVDRDYEMEHELLDALKDDVSIDAVLLVEQAVTGIDGGKYGLVERIRAVDETVRILVCVSSEKRDGAYENWAYKHSVYDIYYPVKESYDIGRMAEHIMQGRIPSDKSTGGKAPPATPEPKEKRSGLFGHFGKNNNEPAKSAPPVKPLITRTLPEASTDTQEAESPARKPKAKRGEKAGAFFTRSKNEKPQMIQPEVIIKEVPVEVIKEVRVEIPVEREVVREVVREVEVPVIREVPVQIPTDRMGYSGIYTVAVFALSHGAGATTAAEGVARILSRYGRTAALSIDGKNDLMQSRGKFDLVSLGKQDDPVAAIQNAASGVYDFLVVDFGTLFDLSHSGTPNTAGLSALNSLILEFFRANLHIGMCFTSPWHIGKLNFFSKHEYLAERVAQGDYIFLSDNPVKQSALSLYSRGDVTYEQILAKFISAPQKHGRGR